MTGEISPQTGDSQFSECTLNRCQLVPTSSPSSRCKQYSIAARAVSGDDPSLKSKRYTLHFRVSQLPKVRYYLNETGSLVTLKITIESTNNQIVRLTFTKRIPPLTNTIYPENLELSPF